MTESWHRHDISDHVWALLEPHLLGRAGGWGRIAHDNRRFLKWGIVDFAHRWAVAGFASGLW